MMLSLIHGGFQFSRNSYAPQNLIIGIGETVFDILFKNINAGYIYAKMQGINDQARRIAMAQRWSQDVCRQLGNNISDELVATLQNERI